MAVVGEEWEERKGEGEGWGGLDEGRKGEGKGEEAWMREERVRGRVGRSG